MLWEDLLREYVAFKAALRAGTRKAADMTDREHAGLWIKLAEPGKDRPRSWPGARALIEQADREEREPS